MIADSFPVMQWALQRYLQRECGRQVLAVVGDSDSLVERLADLPPESILITELGLPGQRSRDGIHLVEWLTRHCPQMKVMVYSVFSAPLLAKAVPAQRRLGLHQQAQPAGDAEGGAGVHGARTDLPRPGLHPQRHTGKPLSPTEVDILRRLARGDTVQRDRPADHAQRVDHQHPQEERDGQDRPQQRRRTDRPGRDELAPRTRLTGFETSRPPVAEQSSPAPGAIPPQPRNPHDPPAPLCPFRPAVVS